VSEISPEYRPIEKSEIHVEQPKLANMTKDELIEKLIKTSIDKAKLQTYYSKYHGIEVTLGVDDYWNIVVAKASDLIKIVKFAPWLLTSAVRLVDILQLIKGVNMKGKSWFWWFTTIVGLLTAIGTAWNAVATDADWWAYVTAALIAIFSFLSDKVKKAVGVIAITLWPYFSRVI
jgi:hypothetical protein